MEERKTGHDSPVAGPRFESRPSEYRSGTHSTMTFGLGADKRGT
jgi:hypothetical protein